MTHVVIPLLCRVLSVIEFGYSTLAVVTDSISRSSEARLRMDTTVTFLDVRGYRDWLVYGWGLSGGL